ncbi:nucleotidyltransferase domain-containing protein [Carnobacterium divergens]|uniref:nucleotidyltransferase domain-containing protein n=1 Tax=Carnobacterium divergens TaxID=2748 RepID=UPI0035D84BC3
MGSYVKGTNIPNSDLDFIVISPNKTELFEKQDFVKICCEVFKMLTLSDGILKQQISSFLI